MEETAIKLEAKFFTEEEEALLAARGYYRGRGDRAGSSRSASGSWSDAKGSSKEEVKMPLNPTGQDGERPLCRTCGSYQHMMQDFPHSWERMKGKALLAGLEDSEEESFILTNKDGMSGEKDNIILFTGNKKKIRSLGSETLGLLLLDNG